MAAVTGELVVLIHCGGMLWVRELSARARAAGAGVAVVTGAGGRDAVAALADRVVEVPDPTDVAAVTGAVRELAAGAEVSAVLSANDAGVVVAAQVSQRLGLVRTPAEPIAVARNKYLTRQRLAAAGLPVPGYAVLGPGDEAGPVAAAVGLPAVVKPVCGTASHEVHVVHTEAELAAAAQQVLTRLPQGPLRGFYQGALADAAGGLDPTATVLVEGRLSGREYCVDVIIRDGDITQLGLVDKFLIDERFFELGFASPPFDLPAQRQRDLQQCVDRAVRAIGLDNTMAHVEVIDDSRLGPTIVEINPGRPAGQAPLLLNAMVTGVDAFAELLAVHRGAPPLRRPAAATTPLAALWIFPSGTGRVRAVHGFDELADHPDVVLVQPTVAPGDLVSDEIEAALAVVMVSGFADREELTGTYYELASLLKVDLDPSG